jgi:hypothetical protein
MTNSHYFALTGRMIDMQMATNVVLYSSSWILLSVYWICSNYIFSIVE